MNDVLGLFTKLQQDNGDFAFSLKSRGEGVYVIHYKPKAEPLDSLWNLTTVKPDADLTHIKTNVERDVEKMRHVLKLYSPLFHELMAVKKSEAYTTSKEQLSSIVQVLYREEKWIG